MAIELKKSQDAYSVIIGNQSTGQSAYLKQYYKNDEMASGIISLFYKCIFWFATPLYNFKETSLIALPYMLHFVGLFSCLQAHCKSEKVNILCCLDSWVPNCYSFWMLENLTCIES